jgi:V/A-type H+-transporting ATPase subunit K
MRRNDQDRQEERMTREQIRFRKRVGLTLTLVITFMAIFATVTAGRAAAQEAAGQTRQEVSATQADVLKWELVAAAFAFGFGAIGAGMAISNVGAAAMGAIAEKPEVAAQALIFIALAEGLVVFGFITALMILGKL